MVCKNCGKEIIRDWGRPKTWCSMKCKYMYNNSKRKSTKRTKQIECKTCGSLSLNKIVLDYVIQEQEALGGK